MGSAEVSIHSYDLEEPAKNIKNKALVKNSSMNFYRNNEENNFLF